MQRLKLGPRDSGPRTQERIDIPLDPTFVPPPTCCEGSPSALTADDSCVGSCVRHRCEDSPFQDCQTGFASVSYITAFADSYDSTIAYDVSVGCSAINVEPRNPDNSWAFIEQPVNQIGNDRPICGAPPAHTLGPMGTLGTHAGIDDSGMQAFLGWDFDGTPGQDSTDKVPYWTASATKSSFSPPKSAREFSRRTGSSRGWSSHVRVRHRGATRAGVCALSPVRPRASAV